MQYSDSLLLLPKYPLNSLESDFLKSRYSQISGLTRRLSPRSVSSYVCPFLKRRITRSVTSRPVFRVKCSNPAGESKRVRS